MKILYTIQELSEKGLYDGLRELSVFKHQVKEITLRAILHSDIVKAFSHVLG